MGLGAGIGPDGYSPSGIVTNRLRRAVFSRSLAEELPYEDVLGTNMIYSDGSVGCCWLFDPVYLDSMPIGEIIGVGRGLSGMLNGMSKNMRCQFVWRKCREVPLLDDHVKQVASGDPLLGILTADRVSYWRKQVRAENVFSVHTEMWMRRHFPRDSRKSLSSLLRLGIDGQAAVRAWAEEYGSILNEFRTESHQVAQPLGGISGVSRLRLAQEPEMFASIWGHLTGFREPVPVYDGSKPIRMALGTLDFAADWGYLSISGTKERLVSVLSLDDMPEESCISIINHILNIPIPMTVTLNVSPVPGEQAKEFLRKNLTRYQSVLVRYDPEAEKRGKEIAFVLHELESSTNQLMDFEMFVTVDGKDLQELEQRATLVSSIANANMQARMKPEKAALRQAFFASLPGACMVGTVDREHRVKTDNVSDVLPVLGPFRSAVRPVMIMKAPYQTLYGYDPFDSRLAANHGLIFGSTGSGKSFTANLLLLSFKAQDPLVFIIDKGGSYKKLTEMLGGSYIDLSTGKISFNPLEGKSNWQDPMRLATRSLVIQEMIRENQDVPVSQAEKNLVENMLTILYRQFENRDEEPTLSDAWRVFKDHKLYDPTDEAMLGPIQRRMTLHMQRWTRAGTRGGSIYASLLDNPKTNVSMEGSFIAFDLLGVDKNPDLQSVVFLTLNDLILSRVTQDRSRSKILVFDEVWSLIKSGSGANFLEELYRTMRKYGTMVLSISQNIDDFSDSAIASAVMNNVYQTFVLKQNASGSAEKIRQVLRLNESQMNIVTSLSQRKGHYSEIFLNISGVGSGRMALYPSPVEYWMATTDEKDQAVLYNYINEGYSLDRAIQDLAKRYPHGVSG